MYKQFYTSVSRSCMKKKNTLSVDGLGPLINAYMCDVLFIQLNILPLYSAMLVSLSDNLFRVQHVFHFFIHSDVVYTVCIKKSFGKTQSVAPATCM
jgi:hypothetical protein